MARRALWVALAALMLVVDPVAPGEGSGDRRAGAEDGVAAGGVLRVGVTPLGSLDPAQARSLEQLLVADQLFDSLTAYDPETLEPVPSLASGWETTPDQRQWTFRLRPGATFANGRPVTSADVKYSLERAARRGSGSPGAELLQLVSGYAAFRTDAPELAGVAATAPDVVQITLEEPWGAFPSALASPVLGVVPKEAVEAQPPSPVFAEAPVGSGPFQVRAREGPVLSLAPSPGSKAAVAIEIVQFDDVAGAYRAFDQGRLDWARVPPEEVATAARRHGDGAFRPYMAELFYGFNLRSPKLSDRRFREAIVQAIDRQAVVAAVYQGTVAAVDAMVLEGVPGHQAGACGRCRHDPARARALLAEAFPPGGPPPPEINLDFDADAGQQAIAKAIQANLKAVGIPATLRPRAVEEYDEFAVSGEQEVFRLGWIAAYPSPDAFLVPLFHSGSPNNLVGLADPEVDEKLRLARAEPDPARRIALYQDAERAVLDQVPVIPMAQFRLHAVVSPRVRGLVPTSLGGFDASVVTLAGEG